MMAASSPSQAKCKTLKALSSPSQQAPTTLPDVEDSQDFKLKARHPHGADEGHFSLLESEVLPKVAHKSALNSNSPLLSATVGLPSSAKKEEPGQLNASPPDAAFSLASLDPGSLSKIFISASEMKKWFNPAETLLLLSPADCSSSPIFDKPPSPTCLIISNLRAWCSRKALESLLNEFSAPLASGSKLRYSPEIRSSEVLLCCPSLGTAAHVHKSLHGAHIPSISGKKKLSVHFLGSTRHIMITNVRQFLSVQSVTTMMGYFGVVEHAEVVTQTCTAFVSFTEITEAEAAVAALQSQPLCLLSGLDESGKAYLALKGEFMPDIQPETSENVSKNKAARTPPAAALQYSNHVSAVHYALVRLKSEGKTSLRSISGTALSPKGALLLKLDGISFWVSASSVSKGCPFSESAGLSEGQLHPEIAALQCRVRSAGINSNDYCSTRADYDRTVLALERVHEWAVRTTRGDGGVLVKMRKGEVLSRRQLKKPQTQLVRILKGNSGAQVEKKGE